MAPLLSTCFKQIAIILYSDGALVYRLLALGVSYGDFSGSLQHSSSDLSADFPCLGRP